MRLHNPLKPTFSVLTKAVFPQEDFVWCVEKRNNANFHIYPLAYTQWVTSKRPAKVLAVSGLLQLPNDMWLVGKRAETVRQYPGHWECVPSGSVQCPIVTISTIQQAFLQEAEEELGLQVSDFESCGYQFTCESASCFDFVFVGRLSLTLEEVQARWQFGEYTALSAVQSLHSSTAQPCVPESMKMLDYFTKGSGIYVA